MEQMHVDVRGLSTLASGCLEQALAVRATGASPGDVAGFASSGAAVTVMHNAVSSVSHKVALQLESTAAGSTAAARGFHANDTDNALLLRRPEPLPPRSAHV